ncbi:hypothetical protein KYC5002_38385 [Archangium violaceum]|uniref:hypothetical protein n=1 Tax=Archangium violaceum TaxID=83451 RepID=UPI002B299B8A|nr:hypothetical protein KYC5002_38385 [Archangium gephyra]
MKVGQNRPSVPTQSTTSTEARKGTPAEPARTTTARSASTFQTGFDTAVRKNTFSVEAAATPVVMTPPPPPENAAPGTTGSKPTDEQLLKVLNEAHQMIFGRDVDQAQLKGWMDHAKKLRDNPQDPNKPLSLDDIKYTLFGELRGGLTAEQKSKPNDDTLKKLVGQAYELYAGFGSKPDASKEKELLDLAKQLRDHPEDPEKPLDADGIKYALFSKLRGAPTAAETSKPSNELLKKVVGQAYELFAGSGSKIDPAQEKELLKYAQQLRDDPEKKLDADGIKYALFSKLRGTATAEEIAKPSDDLLRKMLDEAHMLALGSKADGPNVEGWMNKARALRDDPNNPLDANGVKYALFGLLRGTPTAEQASKPNDDLLKKVVGQAYELYAGFGSKIDPAKEKELLELAKKLRDDKDKPLDADGIKYALFSKLRGNPTDAEMAKPSDDLLRKLLDEAHTLVFGNGANGPNVEAWMARARKLRDDKDNPLDANGIKYALFSQMRQVK